MSLKPSSRLKKRLLKGTGVTLLAAAVAVVLFSLWIELTFKSISQKAMREHGVDRTHALLACVESKEDAWRAKNRALWALAHTGDRRALPSLRKHLTGKPCDHENDLCCQGELQEAIQKLEAGQFDLPEFLWRRILTTAEEPIQSLQRTCNRRPDGRIHLATESCARNRPQICSRQVICELFPLRSQAPI